MSKATLTFNLPEEQIAFNDATKGEVYKLLLYEVAVMLKEAEEADPPKTATQIKDDFWKLTSDEGVDPYDD